MAKARVQPKVMVTREFGSVIYIAPSKNLQVQITDKLEEAEVWDNNDGDNKLQFHRVLTGYTGLVYEPLAN